MILFRCLAFPGPPGLTTRRYARAIARGGIAPMRMLATGGTWPPATKDWLDLVPLFGTPIDDMADIRINVVCMPNMVLGTRQRAMDVSPDVEAAPEVGRGATDPAEVVYHPTRAFESLWMAGRLNVAIPLGVADAEALGRYDVVVAVDDDAADVIPSAQRLGPTELAKLLRARVG